MPNSFTEKLRRTVIYPAKMLRTFSLRNALIFARSYWRGDSHLKVQIKSLPFPIWLRPRASDIRVAYEIFSEREFEMPWPLPDPPRTIIDGGANVGYATIALKQRWPEASVIAIEPDADNFDLLRRNTAELGSILFMRNAIWGTEGSLRVRPDPNAAEWSLQFEEVPDGTPDSIPSVTIPDLFQHFPGNHCDLLKLDIEGAELNIFSQPDISWLKRVSVVLVEIHGEAAKKIILEAARGYHLSLARAGEKVMLYRSANAVSKNERSVYELPIA